MITFTGSPATKGDCSASDLQRVDADGVQARTCLAPNQKFKFQDHQRFRVSWRIKFKWECGTVTVTCKSEPLFSIRFHDNMSLASCGELLRGKNLRKRRFGHYYFGCLSLEIGDHFVERKSFSVTTQPEMGSEKWRTPGFRLSVELEPVVENCSKI